MSLRAVQRYWLVPPSGPTRLLSSAAEEGDRYRKSQASEQCISTLRQEPFARAPRKIQRCDSSKQVLAIVPSGCRHESLSPLGGRRAIPKTFDAPNFTCDAKRHSVRKRATSVDSEACHLLQRLCRVRPFHQVGPELCPFVPMCAAVQKSRGFDEMVTEC